MQLVPELARFVPPARIFNKNVYFSWTGTDLHEQLRGGGADTVIITGGETDVCVLATMLGAIDWGFRVRVTMFYRVACAVALLLLYAAAIVGWAEYFRGASANFRATIVLAGAALGVWFSARAFCFLSTGR
jgi:Isochorismatase family